MHIAFFAVADGEMCGELENLEVDPKPCVRCAVIVQSVNFACQPPQALRMQCGNRGDDSARMETELGFASDIFTVLYDGTCEA